MEFKGRIARLFETKEGVSQRTGIEWKSLPFVFEYFEHDTDRYADTVLLETFDKDIMAKIAPFVEKDADGKEVIVNGEMRLTKMVEARCGFAHRTKMYNGRCFNEVRLYKMEVITEADGQPEGNASCTTAPTSTEAKGEVPTGTEPELNSFKELDTNSDDLPF